MPVFLSSLVSTRGLVPLAIASTDNNLDKRQLVCGDVESIDVGRQAGVGFLGAVGAETINTP